MSKHKQLINSFALANLCDVLLTGLALRLPGFVETGVLGGLLLAQSHVIQLLILKTAITGFMIGIYALAAYRQGRWSGAVEAALRISTIAVWTAVAWNELNIVLALAARM